MKGTEFQIKVWEALLKIRSGSLCTYSELADQVGKPKAVRALSTAVAKNNIALLIPCHRVIRKGGEFNQYRWGATRKQALIGFEAAKKCLE
jgi:AraC family transcriptional regulator of adaptative response/methylated-DNA-[protein]-cysteine methyltransferase